MRLRTVFSWCLMLAALLAASAPAAAQDFRGRINGTVTDNTGAVLPGVTVTATSPALIQPQVQVTGADGTFRFLALPPGVYDVEFELAGFQNVKREGVRVVINQTLTVDQQLNVATLQETVTVTGASPIVDTSTTTMGTNFTKELLTEIPNARDIWAAMAQAPGIQMTGYDVGGSHTGTQTGFRHLRLRYAEPDQDRRHRHHRGHGCQCRLLRLRQLRGVPGRRRRQRTRQHSPAAPSLSISVKSGGDRFTGNWYSDFVKRRRRSATTCPTTCAPPTRPTRTATSSRTPADRAATPSTKQYDINVNVGGPLCKQKAWFFYELAPERPVQVHRSASTTRPSARSCRTSTRSRARSSSARTTRSSAS